VPDEDVPHVPHAPRAPRAPDPPSFASLAETLRLDARRGASIEDTRCVPNTNTLWSVRNEATLREVMRRVRTKEPFGWVRFADGDMNHLEDAAEKDPGGVVAARMRRAMTLWPTLPNLAVSVGEWWLCRDKYRDIWNRRVEAIAPLNASFVFHAGTFYLPAGAPDDDDLETWRAKGIEGWARAALDANVTVALVGPRKLAGVPWLTARGWGWEDAATKRARFVDATGVSDHGDRFDAAMARIEAVSRANDEAFAKTKPFAFEGERRAETRDATEPVLFVFSAGHAAKTMITELMMPDRHTSKDMFVDAGTALDGFAGVGSRDFNMGKRGVEKYCKNVARRDAARLRFWVDPAKLSAVCKGVDVLELERNVQPSARREETAGT